MKPHQKHDKWAVPCLGKPLPATLWSSLSGSTLRCIDASRLPGSPEPIESRVAQWVPRFLVGQIPIYRVDQKGLKIAPPCRLAMSIDWADIALSLDFEQEVKTEYEGFKSAPKLLVLHTTVGPRLVRQRIALPKLREPLGISVHRNSWEIGRTALLQLIHNAPGPLLFSSDVFIDLQINPYTWKRARGPSLALHLYVIAMVASFFPLLQWATQFNLASGWLVMGLVLYALLTTVVGTTIATIFLPVYYGPSIVFCDQEGLFNRPPGHA